MEVDEKPSEDYSDIGGLDKQILELREAIVLPITHRERFKALGVRPPKGVLLHGPPGAVLLRACGGACVPPCSYLGAAGRWARGRQWRAAAWGASLVAAGRATGGVV
jgi:hypothetical protein